MTRLVLTTAALALVGALSAACGGGDATPDATPIDAAPDVGMIELSWAIQNGGTPLECDDVVGISVQLVAIPSLGGSGFPDALACEATSGMTIAVPSNTYDVDVWLASSNGRQLTEPVTFPNIEVMKGQSTSIGEVTFDVVPQGNLEFTVDANAAAGNCDTEANGGAEITEFSIKFVDANDACVPMTFTIGDGANQAGGTYVSDCDLARYGCIDADQTIRADNAPSGVDASLQIVGYRGVDQCYTRQPQFSIPGNGLLTALSPQLLMAVGPCVPAP